MEWSQCPPEKTLDDLCEGRLDAEELSALEGHLEGCNACSDKVHAILSRQREGRAGQPEPSESDLMVNGLLRLGGIGPGPILRPACTEGDLGRLGRYRLLQVVGEGASSVVYRGVDKLLLRPVIVKAFRPGYCAGEDGKRELLEEARMVARFTNDLVAGLLDLGKDGGTPFLVFPNSNGTSLDLLLTGNGNGNGNGRQESGPARLGALETLSLARDLARGLAEIHRQGLLHRDIKPANVVIHMDGEGKRHARLIDLGLSCSRSSRVGTPAYRAPELEAGGIHSVSTDLYAFGRLLDDLQRLTPGQWPRGIRSIAAALVDENPVFRPSLPEVQDELAGALGRAGGNWMKPMAWTAACLLVGFAMGVLLFVTVR